VRGSSTSTFCGSVFLRTFSAATAARAIDSSRFCYIICISSITLLLFGLSSLGSKPTCIGCSSSLDLSFDSLTRYLYFPWRISDMSLRGEIAGSCSTMTLDFKRLPVNSVSCSITSLISSYVVIANAFDLIPLTFEFLCILMLYRYATNLSELNINGGLRCRLICSKSKRTLFYTARSFLSGELARCEVSCRGLVIFGKIPSSSD
jgi:hypothetical protein